jgi:hypothetical protein
LDGLCEVTRDIGEGGEKEIAEAVTLEIAVTEPVLEEAGEEMLVLGNGNHAIADVTGRQHVELFPQASGGATVVSHRDDSGEIAQNECGSCDISALSG